MKYYVNVLNTVTKDFWQEYVETDCEETAVKHFSALGYCAFPFIIGTVDIEPEDYGYCENCGEVLTEDGNCSWLDGAESDSE